ncbi:putative polysaccharide biosynthesis protein [Streptococcus moroccensis]|uniref:O-antigen/teichoic acid export membrane protein n=1 Tax=Streptococcus moroccensis TaxID=1451356 RepID=A0ABT9YQB8_9STRE|nr:polysaccharide biosynthesis protein [Streptococcus moroccensis]MDQ0222188.1 O-antigen/teichoic acid export membrane protein [Streptococcus moroccensis]
MSKQAISQQEKMVQGTLWLTMGNFASRLLGVIYIIPWFMLMGEHGNQANALFNMGYNIYAIFLNISTAGINVAVAKQISKYNSMDRPEMSYKLVRTAFQFMLVLGAIAAGIMYIGAPLFAEISGVKDDLVPVMRSLSWAVLIFPSMSIIRGVFQGFNNMKPYAISQVAEQIIRVIWILLASFFIMKLGSGNYIEAVIQSTFAAFIGMIASVLVLAYYLWKADLVGPIFLEKPVGEKMDTKAVLLETVKEAIPFIITGAAIQIFQLIDQFTFINAMEVFSNYTNEELQVLFSYFAANPNKVYMILISVAIAIGGVGIPLLTENFVKKDKKASAHLIENSLTMLMVFLFPAVVGATILAKPLYTVFYNVPDTMALSLFIVAMLSTFVLGFYTVLAPMLQALFENRNAVKYFLYGALVKLVVQLPFIFLFRAYGPLLSTIVGLSVPIVMMYRRTLRITGFNHQLLLNRGLLVLMQTLVMGVLVLIVEIGLNAVFPVTDRFSSVVHLVIGVSVGVIAYGIMSLATKSADFLIGKNKAETLRKKFKLS